MSRYKYGNPKKKSSFICLKCGRTDGVLDGIQRIHGSREKGHIKDMYCAHCGERTKCLEVRYCDYLPEMKEKAEELHKEYYDRKFFQLAC